MSKSKRLRLLIQYYVSDPSITNRDARIYFAKELCGDSEKTNLSIKPEFDFGSIPRFDLEVITSLFPDSNTMETLKSLQIKYRDE